MASRGSLGLRFDKGDVGHEKISRTMDPLSMHGLGRHLAEGRGSGGGSAASGLDRGRRKPCQAEGGRQPAERGHFHDSYIGRNFEANKP